MTPADIRSSVDLSEQQTLIQPSVLRQSAMDTYGTIQTYLVADSGTQQVVPYVDESKMGD